MLKNFVKIALRNLARHKSFSAINIFGLAVSMSVCLLIILFIQEQRSYDEGHAKKDRIYRIVVDRTQRPGQATEETTALAATPAPLAPALERDVPGIEETLRIGQIRAQARAEGKLLPVVGLYAEPSFFDLFDFTLASGDPAHALDAPNRIVLSQETARRFFGDADPMGKELVLEGTGAFTVAGVLDAPMPTSHLKFDVLASFATLAALPERRAELDDWDNLWTFATYLLLDERAAPGDVAAALGPIAARYDADPERVFAFHVQALGDIALGPVFANEISSYSVPAVMAYFLVALALIVVLVACFNYTSLSVARALKRAREVGVRKTLGAHRGQIVGQFLAEAILTTLLALGLAALMLEWLLPAFNNLYFVRTFQTAISVDLSRDASLYLIVLAFTIGVGLVAGLYPALYLSSFRPARVLKGGGAKRSGSGGLPGKTLVVLQFAVSLFFIVTAVVMARQFRVFTTMEYGFDEEHVVNVELRGVAYETFRNETVRLPGVRQVSATSKLPASGSTSRAWLKRDGMDEAIRGHQYAVDAYFLDNLGLKLLAGRDFSRDLPSDGVHAVILNETAVRKLGLGTPEKAVGQFITFDDEANVRVQGVVRDYQYDLPINPIAPLVLRRDPSALRYANVRVRAGEEEGVISELEDVWRHLDPTHPLAYTVFEQTLRDNPLLAAFRDLLRVIVLIAGVAVTIACLGLLGMAAYTAEVRTKEVGIRKVLGATAAQIVLLLSKEFARLVVIAVVLAVPLAWLVNSLWLNEVAHRVALGPAVFGISVGLLLVLALATVGSQALRAALADPAETVRYE